MPAYGFLDADVLSKILSLYDGYRNPVNDSKPRLIVAGGGEPLLHPNAVDLLRRCKEAGLEVSLITNASRFHLVDMPMLISVVDDLLISFWGIEEVEYRNGMKLDFKTSLANVDAAVSLLSGSSVKLAIQWLGNPSLISTPDQIRQFWALRGVTDIRGGDMMWNRGGELRGVEDLLRRGGSIAPDFSRRVWCSDLYFSDSYSWDGDLILCCCDYFSGTQVRLGNVESLTREDVAAIKRSLLAEPPLKCADCRLPRKLRAEQLAGDLLARLSASERSMVAYD
jgi:hypothetical protein